MSVRVRLTRVGSKKNPIWRVVVADQRSPRDGRFIETVGQYNPQTDPSTIVLDDERLQHWIARGAQPTGTVKQLMKAHAKGAAGAAAAEGAAATAEADAAATDAAAPDAPAIDVDVPAADAAAPEAGADEPSHSAGAEEPSPSAGAEELSPSAGAEEPSPGPAETR